MEWADGLYLGHVEPAPDKDEEPSAEQQAYMRMAVDAAAAFAEVNGLAARTSGSDYHQPEDLARGGMVFDYPIHTEQDFAQALLRGEGVLIQTDKTGK